MTHLTIPIHAITGEYASDSSEAWTIYSANPSRTTRGQSCDPGFQRRCGVLCGFFNVAIAQLLKDISPETLRDKLKIEGLSGHGAELLGKCVENAKGFYVLVP
jgi:hypothetical protein